jgi:hypothetical protein
MPIRVSKSEEHQNQEIVDKRRPQAGLYYVIPSFVMECEDLEHSEIVFYALVSGLALNKGYCFASDEYLAERMRVDERTVRNWLVKLEKFEFLKRETVKKGMYWDRKIYILFKNSNNCYEGTYNSGSNGSTVPDREDAHFRKVGEVNLVSKEVVCNGPPVGAQIERITKVHVDGHEMEISLQDIFKEAVLQRKNWNTQEIQEAWEILRKYNGKIREPIPFFEGTIRNLRNEKKAKHLQKQGKICTNSEISTYVDSKEKLSVEDMKAQPSLGSLLEGVTMTIRL